MLVNVHGLNTTDHNKISSAVAYAMADGDGVREIIRIKGKALSPVPSQFNRPVDKKNIPASPSKYQ